MAKKQLSLMYHIDNLMISHIMAHIVTLFIKKLDHEYGQHDRCTVTRRLMHKYLGTTINFQIKQAAVMSQYEFIKNLYFGT